MKDENKSSQYRKAKKIVFAVIILVVCVVSAVVIAKNLNSKNEQAETLSQLESTNQADADKISELGQILDETGEAYEDYIESKAKDNGMGNPDETVYINEGFGE